MKRNPYYSIIISVIQMERLQKVIAKAGICSRRKAEVLITEGKVKVNGHVVTTLGTTVSEDDKIYVEGKYLSFLLKTKGVESYTIKKDSVNFNFDKEKTFKIPYTLIKSAAIGVPDYKFQFKDNRIYVEIPLTNKNNNQDSKHYIYNLTKFLENF